MAKSRNQNSILFLTTLGVYLGLVLVGAAPQVAAQSLLRSKTIAYDPLIDLDYFSEGKGIDCTVSGQEITKEKIHYLWFNDGSIGDYVRLLKDILEAYPEEQVAQTHFIWSAPRTNPPFRDLDSTGSDSLWIPIDSKKKDDLESDILLLGNGFSAGKGFKVTADRNPSDFAYRLEIKISGIDGHTASSLYSDALQSYRCGGNETLTYFEKIVLDRTEISIESDNLVIVTRLPRGSLYALIPQDAK